MIREGSSGFYDKGERCDGHEDYDEMTLWLRASAQCLMDIRDGLRMTWYSMMDHQGEQVLCLLQGIAKKDWLCGYGCMLRSKVLHDTHVQVMASMSVRVRVVIVKRSARNQERWFC